MNPLRERVSYAPRPTRLPLVGHTLTHIYRQCATPKARGQFIRREIDLVVANARWGFIDKVAALQCLDRLKGLVSSRARIEITTADMEQSI